MGLDKFSNLGSFEEMAEAQDTAPETVKTVETEIATEAKTEVATEAKTEEAPVATDVPADNVETPKNN
jgi:hypothetical protein